MLAMRHHSGSMRLVAFVLFWATCVLYVITDVSARRGCVSAAEQAPQPAKRKGSYVNNGSKTRNKRGRGQGKGKGKRRKNSKGGHGAAPASSSAPQPPNQERPFKERSEERV